MVGEINFSIIRPELANALADEYRQAQQDRMAMQSAKQNQQLNELKIASSREELTRLQQERAMMLDLQAKLKASGKDTNLDVYLDYMISSGNPEWVEKGLLGKQKLAEQRKFAAIMQQRSSISPSTMTPNSQSPIYDEFTSPPTTVAPAAPAAVPNSASGVAVPRNPVAQKFGADQISEINEKVQSLLNLGTPQAIQTATILQHQLEMVARQKADALPKLSDRFVPVGNAVFDRQNEKWVPNPNLPELREADRYMHAGNAVFDKRTQRWIPGPQSTNESPVRLKPGETYNAELDRVEAKPGSDLYVRQSKDHGKDYKVATSVISKLDESTAKLDKILSPQYRSAFEGNFGGLNAYGTQMLPGENTNMRKMLDSFKSDLKLAGLNEMRQGGSIGAMTEKEWPIVQQMIAPIDPGIEEGAARKILEEVRDRFQRMKANAKDVYDTQWEGTQYHKPLNTDRSIISLTPMDRKALEWAKANPNDPRAAEIKKKLGM